MLLELCLTLLPVPAQALAPEEPATRPTPAVVVHRGDLRLRDRLRRARTVRFDAGHFLVADLSPGQVRWAERQGAAVAPLPRRRGGEAWFVVGASEEATLARIEAAGARVLFHLGRQALVAAPAEREELLHDLEPGRFFHCGIARVADQPLPPLRAAGADAPPAGHGPSTPDPRVQALVDQVSGANVEASVQSLSSIFTRRADQPGAVTAQNQIASTLQGYGLAVSLESFGGQYSSNVVAELPGSVAPNEYVVIGAHYDSVNWADGATAVSPGADDNASGSGGVLEAARVLSAAGPFERSLRFVLFSGEELGLLGSDFDSAQSVSSGEQIVAMLNMDMIAYRAAGDARDVDFATNNTSATLTSLCDSLGALYVPGWASTSGVLTAGSSDHASYDGDGWPAAFFFEDLSQYYQQIHTANDAYPTSTTDFLLAEMIVKGVVASAATIAEPIDLSIAHVPLADTTALGPYDVVCQVTSLTGANVTGAQLEHSTDGQTWSQVAMTPAGGDWVAQIPGAGSPATLQYRIHAFDDQGGSETLPEGGGAFSFFVGVRTVLHFFDFEAAGDQGWTHGQDATQDDWQRGAPNGLSGDPASAWSGTNVWGNDLGPAGWNGEYQANVSNWLRSPVFDLSGATGNVTLEFQRWLTVEDAVYDQAQVRVNGAVVWENPAGGGSDHTQDHSWTPQALDVTALAAGNPSVQVEFRLLSDGGLQYGGWNLDDVALVSLEGVSCQPPVAYCTSSPNSVGPGAVIGWSGSTSVAANDLVLSATGCPPNQFGIFFYGPTQIADPFGQGIRCVGDGTTGVFRLKPAFQIDGAGVATYAVDYTVSPANAGSGKIDPGDVWNAQFWYRDPGSGFNLSNALELHFCP